MKLKSILSIMSICLTMIGYAQDWQTDFEKAKALALDENKHLIMVFQGSDWCAPCIKLDREIWSSDEFKSYAKDHFVMLKADFPRKRANALESGQQEKNEKLAEAYNKQGFFPLVVVFDPKGNKLGETGYKKMIPANYIQHLLSFK